MNGDSISVVSLSVVVILTWKKKQNSWDENYVYPLQQIERVLIRNLGMKNKLLNWTKCSKLCPITFKNEP